MARISLVFLCAVLLLSCGGNRNNPDPYAGDSTAGKTNNVSGKQVRPDTSGITDTGAMHRDTLRK